MRAPEMSRPVDLSICIVNWNAGDYLLDCLSSIYRRSSRYRLEVIVVDNNSEDDSIIRARTRFPQVKIICRGSNDGFAVANNDAIVNSTGRYVLLLNPDTLIRDDALDDLIRYMDTHTEVGACGPRLAHPHTGKHEISARAFPDLLPLLWNLSYVDRLFPGSSFFGSYLMTEREHTKPIEVDWLTGACLLVRRKAIAEIGELDANIFMYCEDIDWCYRLRKAGWRVCYLPTIEVAHYRGRSSQQKTKGARQLSVWGARQYVKSILYFYYKHYGVVQAFLLRSILVTTAILKATLWLASTVIPKVGWRTGVGRAFSYLSTVPVVLSYRCPVKYRREKQP